MKNLIFPTLMGSGSDSNNSSSASNDQSVAYNDDIINELSKITAKSFKYQVK